MSALDGVAHATSTLETRVEALTKRIDALERSAPSDRLSIVVLSGDMDRLIAVFMIATGAAAMGTKVTLFFTFWGLQCLIDPKKKPGKRDLLARMLGWFLKKGPEAVGLSQMNFGGMGPFMMKSIMRKHKVPSLTEFLEMSAELGVQINICETSMNLMGFRMEQMIDYPDLGCVGVASFLGDAGDSRTTLFI